MKKEATKIYTMKKEFNFKAEIKKYGYVEEGIKMIPLEKVNEIFDEFIRLLKDKICSASDMETTTIKQIRAFDFCLEEIDKLAGEELK